MKRTQQRIALVAPFFGRDARGRKERFAFAYATHLALEGIAVEVITTTARADSPGENFYRSGLDLTEPFPVYRVRVDAPDRAAYDGAVLAVRHDQSALGTHGRALLEERLRSPDLVAHVRAAADRFDAFVFLDATASTTVNAMAEVAENAVVVPLLDDEPVARMREVAEAIAAARLILVASDAEAALVTELYGPDLRARIRTIGLAVDVVPPQEMARDRVRRATRDGSYVLACGDDAEAIDAMRATGTAVIVLDDEDERDRPALFASARAVAVTGEGLGFVPDVFEAWAYGKPVLAQASSPGAAALVRETGAGVLVPSRDAWTQAIAMLPDDRALETLARSGTAYVEARGGWRTVVLRTSEAIDAMAALDDGRSRDELRAQIAYLYPLVQRQRRAIEAMRVSRFWRLRDGWFAAKRRLGIGPLEDPVRFGADDDPNGDLAALGDPYHLFREQHRLRDEDAARMRALVPFFPRTITFALTIDARDGAAEGLRATVRSLREQIYERWEARILAPAATSPAIEDELRELTLSEPRVVVARGGEGPWGAAEFVGPVDLGDRLEPHALFELALALQDGADVVYTDEDVVDRRGVISRPNFKPDWSPETFLTRDYVGRLCVIRRTLVEEAGGVRDVLGTARWYDALLRVTERTERVAHVAQVLYHRHERNLGSVRDAALAVEVALRRRGEEATIAPAAGGVDVRFAVPGDERVCIVVPTRDRADLLEPCLRSVMERTAYQNFEMVVVDNGSREPATASLLAQWEAREPRRFRVLRDASPFNYSRLNNEAIRSTVAPYVVLLNNDTEIISPDWLEAMLGQARRPGVGAVGALLLYSDGTVQHGGVVLGILGLAGHAHRFLPGNAAGYQGALQFDTNYLAVTGACMMVAREKYEAVGGLDETLAVSYNDVDLCLKLRAAGYRNVFVPRARLYHYESKSRGIDDTPAKVARAMAEVEQMRARWPAWSKRDPYYNPNLTTDAEDFRFRL